ncbi:MAG TPA: hypothetical protein VGQ83_02365 [Polyangia bacterium]|jgi:hypothetical protein
MRSSVILAFMALAGCGPTSDDATIDAGLGGHLREDASAAEAAAPIDQGPPPTGKLVIYAHTDTKLFKADPTVQPVSLTFVGTFDCVGGTGQDPSMTDLAVTRDGNLFGISGTAVYPLTVTGSTVHCASTWKLPAGAQYYGLTFAPAGVLGAAEMLVAANSAGELWAIDTQGQTTQVGTFGAVPANDGRGHTYKSTNVGKAWELSGDIVFLANGGSPIGFATVRDCPSPPASSNCNTVDTLVEINVPALALGNQSSVTKSVRGQVVKGAGCADAANQGYGSMYGIVAWNDKVYGFSRAGNFVAISNVDGSACLVANYASDKFAGAGVTTLAPVIGPD